MLLANIAVAEKIARHFPACSLLRRHPTPPPRQFEPVLRALGAVGLTLDVTSSKVRAMGWVWVWRFRVWRACRGRSGRRGLHARPGGASG